MSIGAWEPIASLLGARHRVLRCDFRGQLRTPGPVHRELAPNADDVAALLDHLGLDRVHVFGTSFGGEIGLLLAARHPDRVTSLVAITVGDHATKAIGEAAREMRGVIAEILAGGDRGRFHDVLVRDVYSATYVAANRELLAERRRQLARTPDSWFAAAADIVATIADFDVRPELGKIRCPTLIVLAADDRAIPPELGRAVAAAIPGAELAEHPTSGHVLIHEDPEWLVARAEQFWGSHR